MAMQRAVLVILSVLMLMVLLFNGRQAGEKPGLSAIAVSGAVGTRVQISGMVDYPGVYVVDKILTISAINMANPQCPQLVQEALKIKPLKLEDGIHLTIKCGSASVEDVVTMQPMSAVTSMVLGIPFSLNMASATDLDLLPGVGPVLAQRIIEYRQNNGDFVSIDGLLQVEGIGEKRLAELKKYLK